MTLADTATTIASSVQSSTDGAVRSATLTRSPGNREEQRTEERRNDQSERTGSRCRHGCPARAGRGRRRTRRTASIPKPLDTATIAATNANQTSACDFSGIRLPNRCNSRTVTMPRSRGPPTPPRPSSTPQARTARARDDDAEQHPPHDVVAHCDRHHDVSREIRAGIDPGHRVRRPSRAATRCRTRWRSTTRSQPRVVASPTNETGRTHPSPKPAIIGSRRLPSATPGSRRPQRRTVGRSISSPVDASRHTAPRPAIPAAARGRHLIAGEQVVRERGCHPAEAARPADDPGRDVADHCRLPDLAGQRTEPERGAEQHRDLREEMRRRVGRDGLERGYRRGSVSSRVASASLGATK